MTDQTKETKPDIIQRLKEASPEYLLEKVIQEVAQTRREEELIQLGFRVAGLDGWKECAPAWIEKPSKMERLRKWLYSTPLSRELPASTTPEWHPSEE